MFDYRLNKIQYCPIKKKMEWFFPPPKISFGDYICADGSRASYPDNMDTIIGICVEDIHDEEEPLKVAPFFSPRIITIQY